MTIIKNLRLCLGQNKCILGRFGSAGRYMVLRTLGAPTPSPTLGLQQNPLESQVCWVGLLLRVELLVSQWEAGRCSREHCPSLGLGSQLCHTGASAPASDPPGKHFNNHGDEFPQSLVECLLRRVLCKFGVSL